MAQTHAFLNCLRLGLCTALILLNAASSLHAAPDGSDWLDNCLALPDRSAPQPPRVTLQILRHDHERLQFNRSILQTPLRIGKQTFDTGLGTHSGSHLRVHSDQPIERFTAMIGADLNERTGGGSGSSVFVVKSGDKELYRSKVFKGKDEPESINIDMQGTLQLDLIVLDAGDGPICDHADWAQAAVTLKGGRTVPLGQVALTGSAEASRYPFSFIYGGQPSDRLLDEWPHERKSTKLDDDRTRITTTWIDPKTGLRVHWRVIRYHDFPALDWVLYFENAGSVDTPILQDIQALNVGMNSPLQGGYRLHRTNGAPSDPTDFETRILEIDSSHPQTMSAGGGRSSNKDFPFFKVETGQGSFIIAVGWSGQWKAQLECPDDQKLTVRAGMELTHFKLHPKEKVRTPRMLVLHWTGDTLESNARFRQLIYKHYCARRDGQRPLPTLFCNTCFTRGGGWLNECNAQNQISLINAYAPLGLELLLTDAGWFEGGWPAGAGNWTPRKDAYPDGMAPVAAAAKARGMTYGLWFEPERVVAGTDIHRRHPEWCLAAPGASRTYLLNFGLPEVQEYFFNIVAEFMKLPGFRVYRQDFNMDPLPYWRAADAPDRQGITEIRYIEGLYAYWDRIAETWPDSWREECASGGRRIDLETVMRMHCHQKTDYWFDNEVDQASLWALSLYLPNNVFVAHLNRMDDYSFHSTMASSLCMGWIADAPDFDVAQGKHLLDRYNRLKHLLIGAYYPLTPYSRDRERWIAMQYHRPDLNEGMVLAFRRPESPYRSAELPLHGLDPNAMYEVSYDSNGARTLVSGEDLLKRFQLTIPERPRSELVTYRKVKK